MKKRYYKPILKDDEHLLHSKENPERFRGLSRDSNNKNQNIPEFEAVDVDEISEREKIEMELEKANKDKETAEIENQTSDIELKIAKNQAKTSTVELLKLLAQIAANNPELVNKLCNKFKKLRDNLRKFFGKKTKDKSNTHIQNFDLVEQEDLTIEEARTIVLEMLSSYISFKRNANRLSKAKIIGAERKQLDFDDMISLFNGLVDKYPQLMDENTSIKTLKLLHENNNINENNRIKNTLELK